MKKTYKIDVDCANCANLMEDAARKTSGVQSATVNFMTLKMNVEFEEGQDPKTVMHNIINLRLDITHLYYPAKNSFQKGRLKRREIFTELLLYTLTT